MRPIDADNILEHEWTVLTQSVGLVSVIDSSIIKNAPTLDVELLRHGHWIERKSIHADGGVVAKCFICKKDIQYLGQQLKFCPNCGAKMDLKE